MGKKKGKARSGNSSGVVAVNKKARRDYEVLDVFEAGLVLQGSELKAIRQGGINLKESYIREISGELFLIGCHVSPYAFSQIDAHEPLRNRKLLMHRKEIHKLSAQVKQNGLSLIPLKVYFNSRGRCKLELALGKGKKAYDKRDDLKRRESLREIQRVMKHKQ